MRISTGIAALAIFPLTASPLARPYAVENYDVVLQADLQRSRLAGEVNIRLHSVTDSAISALEMDAGGALEIAGVTEGRVSQYFSRKGNILVVVLGTPLLPEEHRTVTVRYQAAAGPGLKFSPGQVVASSPSDWMPCNDRPRERATLHLAIEAPEAAKVAASGQLTGTRSAEGQTVTEWRLDNPAAPSWFGFALGSFVENTSEAEGVKLRVLGAGSSVFEPTAAALHFLGEHSGKHYPGPAYTQVFIHGDAPFSMAGGLTLLPESVALNLDKQPEALWRLTGPLAHQWYGIAIGVADWSDLWLSDALSGYLAVQFVGQKLGKDAGQRQLEHARQVYNAIRAQGKDHPLAYTEWTTREDAAGDLPLYKGICLLELLRVILGEPGFAEAIRLYTAGHWDHAATSQDFREAVEAIDRGSRAAGNKKEQSLHKNNAKTLSNLFDTWVEGIPSGISK